MPGQLEGFKNLIARSQRLNDELKRTSIRAERKRIYERLRQVKAERTEWEEQTIRDAESGDSEAKIVLDAFRDVFGDDEDA